MHDAPDETFLWKVVHNCPLHLLQMELEMGEGEREMWLTLLHPHPIEAAK